LQLLLSASLVLPDQKPANDSQVCKVLGTLAKPYSQFTSPKLNTA
jgi:hypothetical protein